MQDLQLIRSKNGVHVYRGIYEGKPAVFKRFDKEEDRREILNYRILQRHNIPTIKTFCLGADSLVMEDISASADWRLGIEADMADTAVAEGLARWYFALHEAGASVPELDSLYFEFGKITMESLEMLAAKLPEAAETFRYVQRNYDKFRKLLYTPAFTLTYNDFYWTNFVVRTDKSAAMMFDYNLLGRGYRLSDFRNVCWGMSNEAKEAFMGTYNMLFFEKHGCARQEADVMEARIDDVAGPVFTLISAFADRVEFPGWAREPKNEAVDGRLLVKAKELFG